MAIVKRLFQLSVAPITTQGALYIIAEKVEKRLPLAVVQLLANRDKPSSAHFSRNNGPSEALLLLTLNLTRSLLFKKALALFHDVLFNSRLLNKKRELEACVIV